MKPSWTAASATTGMIALRSACLKSTPAAQALGARGADVVRGEHFEHPGAREPHDRRRRVVAERDRRQDEMRQVSLPEIGSHARWRPKTARSAAARTRTTASPARPPRCASVSRSIQVFGRTRPARRAGSRARARTAIASAPSRSVVGSRSAPARRPGCGSRATRRSRRAARGPSQSAYCTASGRSKPYCLRIDSMSSARALARHGDRRESVERCTSRKQSSRDRQRDERREAERALRCRRASAASRGYATSSAPPRSAAARRDTAGSQVLRVRVVHRQRVERHEYACSAISASAFLYATRRTSGFTEKSPASSRSRTSLVARDVVGHRT